MTAVGPYLVACALLVVAGVAKTLRPHTTAAALAQLPRGPRRALAVPAVRVLALAEAALGAAAAMLPYRPLAAAVAVSYGAFALFVWYVRAHGGVLATCGCFATPDTPPTLTHVAVDLVLAVCAAGVAAAGPQDTLVALLARQPLGGVPLLAVCAVCAWLVVLVLVALPRLADARRPFEERRPATR